MKASDGNMYQAKRLIEAGAPVNWKNEKGCAPLHFASRCGHTGLMFLLIDSKCEVDITANNGDTPLIFAARNNKIDIVRILVEALCNIEIRGYMGMTAANRAKQERNRDIAEYLTNEAPRVQVHSTHRASGASTLRVDFSLGSERLSLETKARGWRHSMPRPYIATAKSTPAQAHIRVDPDSFFGKVRMNVRGSRKAKQRSNLASASRALDEYF